MSSSSSSSSGKVIVKSEETAGSNAGFKPGQKYPTPSPGNGDRVFYETLLVQRKHSKMAQDWCLAYGVLDWEKAAELQKQINKSQSKAPVASSAPAKSSSNKSTTATKRRRKADSDDDDDDVVDTGLEDAGVWEGRGTVGV